MNRRKESEAAAKKAEAEQRLFDDDD